MVAAEITQSVKKYIGEVKNHGIDVTFAVIFGSQAKGVAHHWSDIDVVLISKRFNIRHAYEDVAELWKIAGEIDSRIEPIACGEEEWEREETPIITIARREGVTVL